MGRLFSAPQDLVLQCLRDVIVGVDTTRASADTDWAQFVEIARREGVLQWFGRGGAIVQALPAEVVSLAQRERVVAAQRNLLLASNLVPLLARFNRARIDVMAFKGVVAAVQFHGDLASRPSGDLDLLVHPRDYDRAAHLLRANGYEPSVYYADALQGVFWNPVNQMTIDLHWGLPPKSARFNHREIWRHRTYVDLIGASVPTFDMTSAIALAAINAVKNYWNVSLRQLVDVFVAFRCVSDDEARLVVTRCRRIGCENFLAAASYVCSELFGDLPQAFSRTIASSKVAKKIGEEVMRHLFEHSAHATPPFVFASRAEYESALDSRKLGRVRDRMRMALTPNAIDKAWIALPDHLHFLYFLLRPIRLLTHGRHRQSVTDAKD